MAPAPSPQLFRIDLADAPCLDDELIAELAAIMVRVESHYGSAQDIEWALADDADGGHRFMLLQARPETVVSTSPEHGAETHIGGAVVSLGRPVAERPGQGVAVTDAPNWSDVLALVTELDGSGLRGSRGGHRCRPVRLSRTPGGLAEAATPVPPGASDALAAAAALRPATPSVSVSADPKGGETLSDHDLPR